MSDFRGKTSKKLYLGSTVHNTVPALENLNSNETSKSLASLWTSLVRGAVSRILKFSARTLDRQIHLNVVPGSALGRF